MSSRGKMALSVLVALLLLFTLSHAVSTAVGLYYGFP
jgi:hypothetical protein